MNFLSQKLAPSQRTMLYHLRKRGEVSRGDLGALSGLSSGAVTRFGRQLIELGLVRERSAEKSAGPGRPTQSLALRPEGGVGMGFAVHPGWVEAVCLDFTGAELVDGQFPFKTLSLGDLTKLQKEFFSSCKDHIQKKNARIGVGLALPGYVTTQPEHRHTVAGLEDWRDLDVQAYLEKTLGFPAFVENDATAAALAEFYCPDTPDISVVMSLTLGPGVGGGVVIDGKPNRGAHGNAGEIGWLYPYGQPRPSARDFLEVMQEAGDRRSLFEWASGDAEKLPKDVLAWCERAGRQLKLAVNAGGGWIDPDRIVVTGALPSGILKRTADALAAQDLFEDESNISRPKPVGSDYGPKAAAVGAAQLVFHALSFEHGSE